MPRLLVVKFGMLLHCIFFHDKVSKICSHCGEFNPIHAVTETPPPETHETPERSGC